MNTRTKRRRSSWLARRPIVVAGLFGVLLGMLPDAPRAQGTLFGEIEARPATVTRRVCLNNSSTLCNEDSDCPGSTCRDRNVFDLTAAVRFNATPAQLTIIENTLTQTGELLFDATDGQAQIGQVTIWNDATGSRGNLWITTSQFGCQSPSGWWGRAAGSITVGYPVISATYGAGCLTHELSHLIFDTQDEYQTTLSCNVGGIGKEYCPLEGTGEEACVMECCQRDGTEFCWGHGDPLNLNDTTNGNHDPQDVTEQSICRGNRSCWDQIGWSWPNTFLVPTGAPDPAANGLTMDPLVFVHPPSTPRFVLVLDYSGSMGLENPTRLERLKVAALDVIQMAADGVELGLVIFSNNAFDLEPIAPLGLDRSAYSNKVQALQPYLATNIGDGLAHARNMIFTAGGVTAQTSILLMTDGVNNRPSGNAEADLEEKMTQLRIDGIVVNVTCTGQGLGITSQCGLIAGQTGGEYVNANNSADLPRNFTDLHERAMGRHAVASMEGIMQVGAPQSFPLEVEPGARVATIVVHWDDVETDLLLEVEDPVGTVYLGASIPQGRFVRLQTPMTGEWTVTVRPEALTGPDRFVARSYLDNPRINVGALAMRSTIEAGESFELRALPMFDTLLVGAEINAIVEKPDGTTDAIQLLDDGGGAAGSGDETAGDGIYSAFYADTTQPGAYGFLMQTVVAGAGAGAAPCDAGFDCSALVVPDFQRETRFSAVVDDSLMGQDCPVFDVPVTPEDGATIQIPAGGSFDYQVQATHPAIPGMDVLLGDLGLPGTATFDHSQANPAEGDFHWDTTIADTGDHAVVFTATVNGCTVATSALLQVVCDSPICLTIAIGGPAGGATTLTVAEDAGCATGGALPSTADLIQGDLAELTSNAAQVHLGMVQPIACDTALATHGFCAQIPLPGGGSFFLARWTGEGNYGAGSSDQLRLVDANDCP